MADLNKIIDELSWRHYIVFNSVLLASKNISESKINLAECGVCDGLTIYFAVKACELLNINKKIYLYDAWENLENDTNYNSMVSQRGVLNLFHSDSQRDAFVRRGNAMILSGADANLLNENELKEMCPYLDFENARFPIKGALLQKRGGTVRHDAVAWGYARQADDMGVDIIQNCEVTGFDVQDGKVQGVRTSRGDIKAKKVGLKIKINTHKYILIQNTFSLWLIYVKISK